jgi:hypothetical protein
MNPADFNPADPFAMLRQLWQNATPSSAQPFMPPMTDAEIERKLSELRVIEGWLTMSLGMLSMQIKAYEMQRAAMAALKPKAPNQAD